MSSSMVERSMSVEERWSEERFQAMAQLWKLKVEDIEKMRELKQRLSDINHWKNCPYEVVRYYSEYHGHLPKVEKMFRYMIKWRQDHDIEHHLERYGDPHPLFYWLPVGILDGTDRDGDGIYLDRMGVADSWSLLKYHGADTMVDQMVFFYELLNTREFWYDWEQRQRQGRRVTKFTVLIDLHELNAGHMRPGLLPLVNRIGQITQHCYSGWAKRIILMRAPPIFKYIWSIAKIFFEQHIRDMITFTTHADFMEVLSDYVDPAVLPETVAPGVGQGRSLPGYFDNLHWEGGPIPKGKELEELLRQHEQHKKSTWAVTGNSSSTRDRKFSTESVTSVTSNTTTASEVSVSVSSVLKGHWVESTQDDNNHVGGVKSSVITAYRHNSSNSLSTLGFGEEVRV